MSDAVVDDRRLGPYLPDLSAFRLSGRRLRLPGGLESRSILVVGFGVGHRGLAAAWVARALAEPVGVPVLEVPVFGRHELWRRGVIDGEMIDGIGDLTVLRRTLTVYVDLDAFCVATGIPDRGTVSVLVADPDGTVRARATGPVDDAAWAVVAGAAAPRRAATRAVAPRPAARRSGAPGPEDEPAYRRLLEAVAAEGTGIGAEAPVAWDASRLDGLRRRLSGDDEVGAVIVADRDGEVVGAVSLGRQGVLDDSAPGSPHPDSPLLGPAVGTGDLGSG